MLEWLGQYLTFLKQVPLRERAFLARQLSTMMESGLPLTQALSVIGIQERNETVRAALAAILHDLEEGHALSAAITKHPRIFNPVFVAAIRSGEASGKLDTVLADLAIQLEKETETVAKLRGAMMYPVFVVAAMILVLCIMSVKVVPQLKMVFADNGAALPWTTQLVIGFSDSLINFWWLYIVLLIFAYYSLHFYLRTEAGRATWNNLRIRMPLLGPINQGAYMGRFARTLSMLVGAGVPIIQALKIVADVMENDIYKEGLLTVANEVSRGVPISVPLQRNKNFPVIISQMALVGEQTGKMDEVFEKLAKYYESQTDEQIKGISALLEPTVLVIIGIGVAFIVFSIIMPLYNLTNQIG